jgi:hypothetical protein
LTSAIAAAADAYGIGTDVSTSMTGATQNLRITEGAAVSDLPLDFNGDFNITLADIATVQTYYRCSAETNPVLWNSKAKYADYDKDGIITVADYLLILEAFNSWIR